jgi:hypothetical protein
MKKKSSFFLLRTLFTLILVDGIQAINNAWTTLEEDYILTWGPVLKQV